MNNEFNAVCPICGKLYHVCTDCKKKHKFTPWRSLTDSINCYKIFITLNDYANGKTDKKKTKIQLQKCDLSQLESFRSGIQTMIYKIINENE